MKIEDEDWELQYEGTTVVKCSEEVYMECYSTITEDIISAQKRAKTVVQVPKMLKFIKEVHEQMEDVERMKGNEKMSILEKSWQLATKNILKELE